MGQIAWHALRIARSQWQEQIAPDRYSRDVRPSVLDAVSLSSAIHGKRGRVAYHLLKAASALLHTAELMLSGESSQSYIAEKLKSGRVALGDVRREMESD